MGKNLSKCYCLLWAFGFMLNSGKIKEGLMAALDNLEKSLDGVFKKNGPKLPEKGRENLVNWLPWINLVIGIYTLLTVYWLWHWAHVVNSLADYANQLSQAFGGS